MKIKEYRINRYGPLSGTGTISLGNFSLLYGNNEEGKSLTIDAIIKMLFNKRSDLNKFEKVQRVDERPDGFLVIDDVDGGEKKLPEAGDITGITNLSSTECRNLFVIRNSELSLASECDFYRSVTDRLTGLMTEEISEIKSSLKNMGKLTRADSTADLADSRTHGEISSRVKKAKKLTKEIEDLQKEAGEKGYDKLEEQLSELDEEIDKKEHDIESMEIAEKRERYEKTSNAIGKLRAALEMIKELSVFDKEEEQAWRDAERDLASQKDIKKDLVEEISAKKAEARGKNKTLKAQKRRFDSLADKKRKVDEEIKVEIRAYEKSSAEVASQAEKEKYIKEAAYGSTLLLIVLIVALMFVTLPVLMVLTGIFGLTSVLLWVIRIVYAIRRGRLKSAFESIRLNAAKLDLEADTVEEILKRIGVFEEDHNQKNKECGELENEITVIENSIKDLEEKKLPEVNGRIEELDKKIDETKTKSGAKNITEYAENMQEKQKNERIRNEQSAILESYFGSKGNDWKKNLSDWERDAQKLEQFKNGAESVKFDEELLSTLKSEKKGHEESKGQLTSEIGRFKQQLTEIENRANDVLRSEEGRLLCGSSVDLGEVKKRVGDFVVEVETNRERTLRIIGIFEEIEREEEEKVHALFGKDSMVSKHFSEITEGAYTEVEFNPEERKITVRKKDGKTLDAEKLSGGAYDQLYLSIRLALGDKFLKGDKGFFIMDDPFIKADPGRLNKQMEILRKISGAGWQIVYFSAKGEVRDCLAKDIKSNNVSFIEIKDIRQ